MKNKQNKIVQAMRNIVNHILFNIFYRRRYDKIYFKQKEFNLFRSDSWSKVYKYSKINKMQGTNLECRFPVSPASRVVHPENIIFDPSDLHIFDGIGQYYQGIGKKTIGKGTWIASNVGIITSNHTLLDLEKHDAPKDIYIRENCWIGMNSLILPGVILGDNTIVGGGSVVTKSFTQGHVVIAGNPEKLLKNYECLSMVQLFKRI